MYGRNRAEGWKHAKLSGHENEELVETIVENDGEIQSRLLYCAGKPDAIVKEIAFGGLREQNVPCILGGATKAKTDIHVYLDDDTSINVSIKKSAGGQVFLIGVDRFMEGFEIQFNKIIPAKVKRAISLFWGTASDTIDIVNDYAVSEIDYQLRKHRLTKETLDKYDRSLSDALLNWFNDNLLEVFDFCFSTGLAANKNDWANLIWYRNELGENDMDDVFNITDIKNRLPFSASWGNRTGGSTIQLPFGFVQWHSPTKTIPGCMQFHHSYEKIKELMDD